MVLEYLQSNSCCQYLQWLLPKLGLIPTAQLSRGKGQVNQEELLALCPFAVMVTPVILWTSLCVVKSHRNRPLDWVWLAGFEVNALCVQLPLFLRKILCLFAGIK